ncbi:unnamed protein product, partial [Heterosigma akashiwo]
MHEREKSLSGNTSEVIENIPDSSSVNSSQSEDKSVGKKEKKKSKKEQSAQDLKGLLAPQTSSKARRRANTTDTDLE